MVAKTVLSDLYDHIDYSGEPLPLAWVVANGDAFLLAWASSANPELMLRIAGRVVSRPQLVTAACAVARTALPFVTQGDLRPLRAIEAAEAWARGEATVEDVRRAAEGAWKARGNSRDVSAYNAADAAASASYAPIEDTNAGSAADDAAYAARYALRAHGSIVVHATYVALAKIIREHIRLTIADLVRAGKNGWEP